MYDNDDRMFTMFVIGVVVGALVVVGILLFVGITSQEQVIKAGCAQYNSTNGDFEFIESVPKFTKDVIVK